MNISAERRWSLVNALEYMERQLNKHRSNYEHESARGASEEMLRNIEKKIRYYVEAVEALKKVGAGNEH